MDTGKLKDKIKSTIYTNGRGAINAADHQALLLDIADAIDEVEVYSEGYAEQMANTAELNAKSYADNAIAEAITNTINTPV